MPRFEKTSVHPASAVLVLLGIYAIAGAGYAWWMHSDQSILIWIVVAVLAFIASFAFQRYVVTKRRRSV